MLAWGGFSANSKKEYFALFFFIFFFAFSGHMAYKKVAVAVIYVGLTLPNSIGKGKKKLLVA